MPEQDGQKLVGRFIKAGSELAEKVSVERFSFSEICRIPMTFTDNTDNSIVIQRLHDPEHMKKGVRKHGSIDSDLVDRSQLRPVMIPLDFTQDWMREKQKAKRRQSRFYDDEDDFDFEEFERERRRRQQERKNLADVGMDEETTIDEATASENEEAAVSMTSGLPTEPPPIDSEKSLKDLQEDSPELAESLKQMASKPPPEVNKEAVSNEVPKESQPEVKSNFVPYEGKEGATEDAAIQTYKNSTAQVDTEQVFKEAQNNGYEDGFRQGEEKATRALKADADAMFSKINALIEEFENLKHLIFESVQDNFYEVCQGLAEALIKRELSVNPEALNHIIKEAVETALPKDDFKVKVHPQTLEKLKSVSSELSDKFVESEEVEPGDFQIASELSVVDGNITKIISDLLTKANLNLFEDEQAS